MVLKEDQERVLKILKETIALLCKNGLNYISDLKIEGLIGVTIDKSEIFLVNLNECITYDNKLHPNDEEQTIIKSVTTTSHNVNTFSSVVHCNRLQLIDNNDNHNDRNNNNNNNNTINQSNDEIIKNVKVELDCDSDNSPYDDLDLPDPSTIEINNNEPPICQLISDKNCSGLPSPLHLNENTWIKVHEVRTKNQMLRHSSQSYRVNNSIGKHGRLVGQSTELRTTENCILNDRYIMQQHRHNELTSLSSSSLIDDKLRSHPVVCNMCGKRFPRKLFLQAHLSTQHGLPKPFKCGKCGKGYAYKQQLNKHLLQCSFSVQTERT